MRCFVFRLTVAKARTMSVHPPPKRKEIYKYSAPWTLYSMNWSVRPDKRFRLAVGSFVEEYNNKVQIVQLDEDTSEFVVRSTFDHPYPTTKIMWIPDSVSDCNYYYYYYGDSMWFDSLY